MLSKKYFKENIRK